MCLVVSGLLQKNAGSVITITAIAIRSLRNTTDDIPSKIKGIWQYSVIVFVKSERVLSVNYDL